LKKKAAFGILLGLLLAWNMPFAFKIPLGNAAGTIYIRADGSVDPSSAPIANAENIYYTFTADIQNSIVVERNNIVINGAGHTLQGLNSGYGIELTSSGITNQYNVTIANTTITKFSRGIHVAGSSNTIVGNNITNNNYGVYLDLSSFSNSIFQNTIRNNSQGIYVIYASTANSISANKIANNQYGLQAYSSNNSISKNEISNNYVDGLTVAGNSVRISENNITNNGFYGVYTSTSNSTYRNNTMNNNRYNFRGWGLDDVDVSNTVGGKPVYYWLSKQNMTVPTDAGCVALLNCTGITIQNLNFSNNGQGILLENTINTRIIGNMLTNNYYGIWLDSTSNNNTVSANNVTNNFHGIYLSNSQNNSIFENTIIKNDYGMLLDPDSNNNSICENKIARNTNSSINVFRSSNNNIFANNVTDNGEGIYLGYSLNSCVTANAIAGNDGYGVYLSISSRNNSVFANTIAHNLKGGIRLDSSWNNSMSANNITNSHGGIYLYSSSDNNTVSANNIMKNFYGVYFDHSSSNLIYHNNFVNNSLQVSSAGGNNTWDNGYPSGGNYWSNYIYNGTDRLSGVYQNETGSDGIGDGNYEIDAFNNDRYPLMGLIGAYDCGLWDNKAYYAEIVSNSTVSAFNFDASQQLVSFNVTGYIGSVGFCKITMDNSLLSGPYTVSVDATPVTPLLASDGTHSSLYFTYTHSTRSIRILGTTATGPTPPPSPTPTPVIPEYSIWILFSLFLAATMLLISMNRRTKIDP
jgi:parallel beta-helix repeat protein